MTLLILGLTLFIGIHLLPSFPAWRGNLVQRWGERRYKAVFAGIALAGLVLLVMGKAGAPFVSVYSPPAWGRHVTPLFVLAAFILLPAAHMRSNIKRYTRHPMLWGVTLWALGHLLSNGDLASLILFGSLAAYSLFDMASANLRGAVKSVTVYPLKKDATVVAAGVVTYVVFLLLHPYLFGVPVFAGG